MNKEPHQMSPQEWLDYQRRIHGYTNNPGNKEILDMIFDDTPTSAEPKSWASKKTKEITDKKNHLTHAEFDDWQISTFVEPVISVLTESERKIIDDVFINVFPTYDVNGFAGKTPRGDKIIMLHNGIIWTTILWGELYQYDITHKADDDLVSNTEVRDHLAYIASYWIGDGAKKKIEPNPLDERAYSGSSRLSYAAIVFILGHEMGHIIENHHKYDNSRREYNHDMEHSADIWGLRLCLRASFKGEFFRNIDPFDMYDYFMMSLTAPFFALGIIATLTSEESVSHPSAEKRFQYLINEFSSVIDMEFGEDGFSTFLKESFQADLSRECDYIFHRVINYGEYAKKVVEPIYFDL